MTSKDSIGDRMKTYEAPTTTRKAFKGQPIIVRLDGSNFHAFTRGLKRPYDKRLSDLMIVVTSALVDRFGASAGYTQSDEITLGWFVDSTSNTQYPFDGRLQKMESLMAAFATVMFNKAMPEYLPEKKFEAPIFDARAFVVPNLLEAYHSFFWRQQDCTKNAISMAAQSMFSHKSLQGQNSSMMQERMFSECGINFNDYPAFFRRGTFVRRVKVLKELDFDTARLLESRGIPLPEGKVERTELQQSNAWLSKLEDPVAYLFKGGSEIYRSAPSDTWSEP